MLSAGKGAHTLAELRRRRSAPYLLELDLTQPLLEDRPTDVLGRRQSRRRAVLPAVLAALRDGAGDAKVCGLIAKVGARRMGIAQAQELRDRGRRVPGHRETGGGLD